MSEQDEKQIQCYVSFPERTTYTIERDPLSYHVLKYHTAKPSPALPTDHVFIPCFFIQIPHKVPILSETISLLLREGRKHKIGQKAELDLLKLALLEWELLRKAQTYFYIVYSYKYYVVQNEHSVSKLASSCIINQILNLNLGVLTDLGQIQKRKKDTHM